MSKYLIKTAETYRIDTEEEVEIFLSEVKTDTSFELVSYTSTKKTTKDDE